MTLPMREAVTVFEMGPRDGLQNEKRLIETGDKIRLVDMLSGCGFRKIEVTSFVSPKWVPQMADAGAVMDGITRKPGIDYAVLTPNMNGFQRAMEARASEVAIFASASEGFSRKNINCSVDESLERFRPVAEAAKAAGVNLRGYISCVTDCPYDGPTPPQAVARLAQALSDMGCYQVSLGDTIGHATPEGIAAMLTKVLDVVPAEALAGHYHDTKGHALENIQVSLDHGLRVFDASVAGLGGCPYAPGASGNVATEAVVDMVEALGFETGLNRARLAETAAFATSLRTPQ